MALEMVFFLIWPSLVYTLNSAPILLPVSNSNLLEPKPPLLASAANISTAKDIFLKQIKGANNFQIYYDNKFQLRCLDAINRRRLWHENTPPLVLGDNFTQYTIDRAWSILSNINEGKREIVKGQYAFGESFFWYYDPIQYRTIEDAINTWYEESRNYDYGRPGFSSKTGGFTQLVWKGSREAACVKIEYDSPQSFNTLVVVNFWPAGNVKGEFPMNVQPMRPTRPDLIEPPTKPANRPWPRPPYSRPIIEPTYPMHPIRNHNHHHHHHRHYNVQNSNHNTIEESHH